VLEHEAVELLEADVQSRLTPEMTALLWLEAWQILQERETDGA